MTAINPKPEKKGTYPQASSEVVLLRNLLAKKGVSVSLINTHLSSHGLDPLPLDEKSLSNYFSNPIHTNKIRTFQAEEKIPQTGRLDEATLSKLFLKEKTPVPDRLSIVAKDGKLLPELSFPFLSKEDKIALEEGLERLQDVAITGVTLTAGGMMGIISGLGEGAIDDIQFLLQMPKIDPRDLIEGLTFILTHLDTILLAIPKDIRAFAESQPNLYDPLKNYDRYQQFERAKMVGIVLGYVAEKVIVGKGVTLTAKHILRTAQMGKTLIFTGRRVEAVAKRIPPPKRVAVKPTTPPSKPLKSPHFYAEIEFKPEGGHTIKRRVF